MRFEKKANKVELRITKQPRRAGVKNGIEFYKTDTYDLRQHSDASAA